MVVAVVVVVLLPTVAGAASMRTVAGAGVETGAAVDVMGPATMVGKRSCNGIDDVGRVAACIDEEDGVE